MKSKAFAVQLRRLCRAQGFSLAELAAATGLNAGTVAQYGSGRSPSRRSASKIAAALGVPVNTLVDVTALASAVQHIPLARRMEIFAELVQLQDTGVEPVRSRRLISAKFAVHEDGVRRLEEEGLAGDWPPL